MEPLSVLRNWWEPYLVHYVERLEERLSRHGLAVYETGVGIQVRYRVGDAHFDRCTIHIHGHVLVEGL